MSRSASTVIRAVAPLLLLACSLLAAADRTITEDQARVLAVEALRAIHQYAPSVELKLVPAANDFYTFEATWPNPEGNPRIGDFAINPWTGEVWEAVACRHVTSARIRAIQQSIRSRFHYQPREYKELRARTPGC